MSIHKSLSTGGHLVRVRSVLTRYERILELRRTGRWSDDASPYGLPKVRVLKLKKRVKEKKKKEEEETAEVATTTTTTTTTTS